MQANIDDNKIKLNGLLNLSSSFVYIIIICAYFFLVIKSKKEKIVSYVLFFLNFLTLILMARRAALLGIFSGVLLSLLFYRFFNKTIYILFIPIFSIMCILIFHPYAKNTLLIRGDTPDRILKFKEGDFNTMSSVGFRLYEWERSLKRLKESPFIGTGLGRKIMKEQFFKESPIGHPHNTLISLALQSGIQTLFTFLCFYFILFIKNFNLRKICIKKVYFFSLICFIYMISILWIFMFAGVEEKAGFIPFWIMSGATLGMITYSNSKLKSPHIY